MTASNIQMICAPVKKEQKQDGRKG